MLAVGAEIIDFPPIEQNQFVSRKSPVSRQESREMSENCSDNHVPESTFVESVTQEKVCEDDEQNVHERTFISESDLLLTETKINIQTVETLVHEIVEPQTSNNENENHQGEVRESRCHEEKSTDEAQANDKTNLQNTEITVVNNSQQNDASNKNAVQEVCVTKFSDKKQDNTSSTAHKQKAKAFSSVIITRKTAADEQEDPLITRLDKKIDKELQIIQGNSNDDDQDDNDIEENIMNDLLYGQRAKELNEFLNS